MPALIDSGASICLFDGKVARAIGIKVESGRPSETEGIGQEIIRVYHHPVRLYIMADVLDIVAAFSDELSATALLGRRGFFDHYRVTFDPSDPPGFEIERVRP